MDPRSGDRDRHHRRSTGTAESKKSYTDERHRHHREHDSHRSHRHGDRDKRSPREDETTKKRKSDKREDGEEICNKKAKGSNEGNKKPEGPDEKNITVKRGDQLQVGKLQHEQRSNNRDVKASSPKPSSSTVGGAPTTSSQFIAPPLEPPSKCILLKNVFDPSVKESDRYYLRTRDEIQIKCEAYGPVHHVFADRKDGSVYAKFNSVRSATEAKNALHGSSYKENLITAEFVNLKKYDSRFATRLI